MNSKQLPIQAHAAEVRQKLSQSQVLIVSGLPGCGKSTQIPQMIYGHTLHPVIVTQPRRLAAVEMAKRVSEELGGKIAVDYTVRFEDTASPNTQIRFVTDGVLLRLLMDDRFFEQYKSVVIDEVHERTLFIDLILLLLNRKLRDHPDVRLVLMSATMKVDIFERYFKNYKLDTVAIESSRLFRLDIHHIEGHSSGKSSVTDAVECVANLHMTEPMGDILVFLPGAEECLAAIQGTQERLMALVDEGKSVPSLQMHALFGTQAVREQELVFQGVADPQSTRKVIFATNIAETSLTIENVAYVVDSGLIKRTQFNKDSATVQLKTCLISRSQAIQRAGRAGRTRHGKAIRLYSKQIYQEVMHEHGEADIKRSDLRSFIVMVMGLGILDFVGSDFIEEPDPQAVNAAIEQLFIAGIVAVSNRLPEKSESGRKNSGCPSTLSGIDSLQNHGTPGHRTALHFDLTELGRLLHRFPVDPLLAKLLVASKLMGLEDDGLRLVALGSSTESLMNNTFEAKKEYFKQKAALADLNGDFFTQLVLIDRKKELFHQKALQSLKLIQGQLRGILDKLPFPKIKKAFELDPAYQRFQQLADPKSWTKRMDLALQSAFACHLALKGLSKNEYRLVGSGISILLDSESVFEVVAEHPTYVLGTHLRGEGHLGIPTLCNVFQVRDPAVGLEFVKRSRELEAAWKHPQVTPTAPPAPPSHNKSEKAEEARRKYLERKRVKTS